MRFFRYVDGALTECEDMREEIRIARPVSLELSVPLSRRKRRRLARAGTRGRRGAKAIPTWRPPMRLSVPIEVEALRAHQIHDAAGCRATEDMSETFRIIPRRPLYKWISYWKTWRRVLMMEGGNYLELELTPLNSDIPSSWDELRTLGGERLFWCGRGAFADKNSNSLTIPGSWTDEMRERLGADRATWLLTGDVWSKIQPCWPNEHAQVQRWLRDRGENGGIAMRAITSCAAHIATAGSP